MTDPDWVPIMKKAAAIITDRGGRTCHAAIVSRELGIPSIIGTSVATKLLKDGDIVTADCSKGSKGYVYEGAQPFVINEIYLNHIPEVPVDVLLNIADPDMAFETSFLPVKGVGLARMEFVINNIIYIHPMAALHPKKVIDRQVIDEITKITSGYENPRTFFVSKLAQGIGKIAAAFNPAGISKIFRF